MFEIREQAYLSSCLSLVDDIVLEESGQVARETLLDETDAHRVREELSQRLLLEVVEDETYCLTLDTYRYCNNKQYSKTIEFSESIFAIRL